MDLLFDFLRSQKPGQRTPFHDTYEVTYRRAGAEIGKEWLIDDQELIDGSLGFGYEQLPAVLRAKWSPDDWRAVHAARGAFEPPVPRTTID